MNRLLIYTVLFSVLMPISIVQAKPICRAILLVRNIEDPVCLEKDEKLMSLAEEDWNRLVCKEEKKFSLQGATFTRVKETYNLKSEGTDKACVWEIRGHAG